MSPVHITSRFRGGMNMFKSSAGWARFRARTQNGRHARRHGRMSYYPERGAAWARTAS